MHRRRSVLTVDRPKTTPGEALRSSDLQIAHVCLMLDSAIGGEAEAGTLPFFETPTFARTMCARGGGGGGASRMHMSKSSGAHTSPPASSSHW